MDNRALLNRGIRCIRLWLHRRHLCDSVFFFIGFDDSKNIFHMKSCLYVAIQSVLLNYKTSAVLMMCVRLCRLGPSPCSIWSNPPGSAGGRPSQPPRATLTASTPARRLRATPRATKSTVLPQPSRPEPPRSPALHPTTSLPPSKAPTVPLCPTTLSDTLSPPNRAPTLGK